MRSAARLERPRPRSLRSGAFFVRFALACVAAAAPTAAPVAAQEPDTLRPVTPQPPDTLPRPLIQDTLPQDTVDQDTLVPPPRLPALPDPGPAGWAAGVWRWTRDDLLRLPDLSVVDLLNRVPGVVPLRIAPAGQAETAGILGATAGAITYIVDGFTLDPLTTPTFDAARIPLLALESVTLERRLNGATVRIVTLSPEDPRTHSIIEAATGDFDINLFRGIFLTPSILGGPLAAGFERLAGDRPGAGSANQTAGWLKWTFVRDSAGVQLEYRQSSIDRSIAEYEFAGERRDWTLRARARRFGITGELYGGATTVEDEEGGLVLREGTPQAGVRLATTLAAPLPVQLRGALRLASHPRLPDREAEVEAWVEPLPWVGLGARAAQGWWEDGEATGRWSGRAVLAPFAWLSAFGEVDRGGPVLGSGDVDLRVRSGDDAELFTLSRNGYRAGAELAAGRFRIGGAWLHASRDSVAASGLAFDSLATRFAAGDATGYEATVRIPTFLDPIRIEGWYVGFDRPDSWIYLPEHDWRAALVYHHSPLPSGNLEIYARLEHAFRGRMSAPAADGTLVEVGAYRATNLELTIRVVSVRAFLRWENLLHRLGQQGLPDYVLPGQRILYGVKWEFWN